MIFKKSLIKRIHVNQANMRANHKDGGKRAVFSVVTSKGTFYGHNVDIRGPSELVYNEIKPLSCGARIWIKTLAEVELT